jgi:hypothetical protein
VAPVESGAGSSKPLYLQITGTMADQTLRKYFRYTKVLTASAIHGGLPMINRELRVLALATAVAGASTAFGQASEAGAIYFETDTSDYGTENEYLIRDDGPQTPISRLPSGEPDLGGDGVWSIPWVDNFANARNEPGPAPARPWARAMWDYHHANISKYDPEGFCLPPGGPRSMATPYPAEIVQNRDRILIIFEGGGHVWREIHMDGRAHPEDVNPTYFGHSVGHWEGDTLVIDTVGYNEKSWLDYSGNMHTDQLHTVEYITRQSKEKMNYRVTIDDPGAYLEPWTAEWDIPWEDDRELLDYVCQENNKFLIDLHDDLGEPFFEKTGGL